MQELVLDEMQRLQNPESEISKDIKSIVGKLKGAKILGVTGTPMENRLKSC